MKYLISYPRSGHHYLVDLMKAAAITPFVYLDPYKTNRSIPHDLQKVHDRFPWQLANPTRILVLTRDPVRCVESRIRQMRREGSTEDLVDLHERLLADYQVFTKEWILPVLADRRIDDCPADVVTYEDLCLRPLDTLLTAMKTLGFETNALRAIQAIMGNPPCPRPREKTI